MFGFGKKKITHDEAILLAVEASLFLWEIEQSNGGLMTQPKNIDMTTLALAKREGLSMSADIQDLVKTFVMAFLMEKKFIGDLSQRQKNGTFTSFNESDIKKIESIIDAI